MEHLTRRRRRSLALPYLIAGLLAASGCVSSANANAEAVAAFQLASASTVIEKQHVQAPPVSTSSAAPVSNQSVSNTASATGAAAPVAPDVKRLETEQNPKTKKAQAAKPNCWLQTAERYNLDPYLLFAVAMVESGLNPRAVNMNRDAYGQVTSADLGMMQINTMHLPMLAQHGITPNDLAKPCVSIRVGGWILALNIYKYGYNWRAIGAYNAGQDKLRARYARAVYAMYDRLKSWAEHYTATYIQEHGKAPSHVPKPPATWQTPATWKSSLSTSHENNNETTKERKRT